MKNITFIIALTVLVGCGPSEWQEKEGCTSSTFWNAASGLGFSECKTYSSYVISDFYDANDHTNLVNIDQWKAANKAGFETKEEWITATEAGFDIKENYIKAKENNINTKENLLNAVKMGGFYNTDNYYKAKELGIKTQAELTKHEYNEMLLAGMRTAGAYYAVNEMCQDISRYLIASASNNSDQRLFLSLTELFDRKNSLDMSKINPLNDDESRAFENAKNNEFGNFYNQLNANTSNQKWLMDYLTKNCAPRMIQICEVSRARNDRSVVKTCDDLSAYGL